MRPDELLDQRKQLRVAPHLRADEGCTLVHRSIERLHDEFLGSLPDLLLQHAPL